MPELDRLIRRNESSWPEPSEWACLPAETAAAYGVSGPVARATGLDIDLRRDDPYLAYGQLDVPVVTRTAGDCARPLRGAYSTRCRVAGPRERCLDRVDRISGPVNIRLPKVVKAPEGHTYAWTESPLGINGYYLVSRGEKTPWRMKLRTASFANVQALSALLPGARSPISSPILGSMFFVVGDIDK